MADQTVPGGAQPAEVIVNDANFEAEVLKSNLPVLVDFWAVWCGPCKVIGPIVSEIAHEMAGKVKVCKMDVDANNEIPQKYGIMSIPTLMIFKNGEMVDMFVGSRPKEDIVGRLNKVVGAQ